MNSISRQAIPRGASDLGRRDSRVSADGLLMALVEHQRRVPLSLRNISRAGVAIVSDGALGRVGDVLGVSLVDEVDETAVRVECRICYIFGERPLSEAEEFPEPSQPVESSPPLSTPVREALEALPPGQRQAVELIHLRELSV